MGAPRLVTEHIATGKEDPDADIRWDGCANWGVSTRGLAVHTCCGNDVQNLAEILLYLYKRAGELIPNADEPWGH